MRVSRDLQFAYKHCVNSLARYPFFQFSGEEIRDLKNLLDDNIEETVGGNPSPLRVIQEHINQQLSKPGENAYKKIKLGKDDVECLLTFLSIHNKSLVDKLPEFLKEGVVSTRGELVDYLANLKDSHGNSLECIQVQTVASALTREDGYFKIYHNLLFDHSSSFESVDNFVKHVVAAHVALHRSKPASTAPLSYSYGWSSGGSRSTKDFLGGPTSGGTSQAGSAADDSSAVEKTKGCSL